jgi:hypothetical protein
MSFQISNLLKGRNARKKLLFSGLRIKISCQIMKKPVGSWMSFQREEFEFQLEENFFPIGIFCTRLVSSKTKSWFVKKCPLAT